MQRPLVAALGAVLGKRWAVLDDGFVRVIDYLGGDAAIVQAARVSYGAGTKRVHEDEGLIRYLMRHHHTTPFEMCEIKLHVRVPMDAWRQWIRHRTANVNEYSTRYSIAIDAAQSTPATEWRRQDPGNKQGSADYLDPSVGSVLTTAEKSLHETVRQAYQARIDAGVAREQARKDLTLSTYTEAYWKIDLHNLLHFLALRMAPQAQHEIRSYAKVIGEEIVARWCPLAWAAFLDYQLHATRISVREEAVVRALAQGDAAKAIEAAKRFGWLSPQGTAIKNRERAEAEHTLKVLGFGIPWAT